MQLSEFFARHPKAALAFSGGTDSALLLQAGVQAGAQIQPYFVSSPFQPAFERQDAQQLAARAGVTLRVIELDPLADPQVRENGPRRCYYCKRAIFTALRRQASADGYDLLLDGTNASDDAADRPGMQALAELGVRSPLRECGITKLEVRRLSRELGLFTWQKPSYACLATRIPTGRQIDPADLARVEGAENCLAGQGYRAATIGEKFITTRVGMYGFYPNPDLESEHSLNFELGMRQLFKSGIASGYFDVAGFHQLYWNYIEFFMGPWNPDETELFGRRFGFEFFNTGRATISGVEASFATQLDIAENFQIQLQANYTYSLPVCREPEKIYKSTASKDYMYSNSSSNTEGNILKYRIQHMAKFDVDFRLWRNFSLGLGVQYMSAMKNVDKVFVEMDKNEPGYASWLASMDMDLPFYGIAEFMRQHAWGSLVLDLRASVDINKFTISFVVNNLLNAEYSLRPLYIEAPLNYTLQLVYRFQDINPLTWFKRSKADVARL